MEETVASFWGIKPAIAQHNNQYRSYLQITEDLPKKREESHGFTNPPEPKVYTEAWCILQRWLPSFQGVISSEPASYWWNLTGRHLAILLQNAGYPMEKQIEALLIHRRWVVHFLGPVPDSDLPQWGSLLTPDGTPIEYSWKWHTSKDAKPQVRYTFEGILDTSNTELDPLNQLPTQKILQRIQENRESPPVELDWFNKFKRVLYDDNSEGYMMETKTGLPLHTTMAVALEFAGKGIVTKTYMSPRKLGQTKLLPLSDWEAAIRQVAPNLPALEVLKEFLSNDPGGEKLKPFMLAIDNQASSRIKLYFQTPSTSVEYIDRIMTLNGLLTRAKDYLAHVLAFQCLNYFVGLLAGNEDHPTDKDFPDQRPHVPTLASGYVYYFDIAPDKELPEVKVFIPVSRFDRTDLQIAQAICTYMKRRQDKHGPMDQFNEAYIEALECIAGDLSKNKGMHTFISYMYKAAGTAEITSYLNPQIRRRLANGHGHS